MQILWNLHTCENVNAHAKKNVLIVTDQFLEALRFSFFQDNTDENYAKHWHTEPKLTKSKPLTHMFSHTVKCPVLCMLADTRTHTHTRGLVIYWYRWGPGSTSATTALKSKLSTGTLEEGRNQKISPCFSSSPWPVCVETSRYECIYLFVCVCV